MVNVLPACANCNAEKGQLTEASFDRGLLLNGLRFDRRISIAGARGWVAQLA